MMHRYINAAYKIRHTALYKTLTTIFTNGISSWELWRNTKRALLCHNNCRESAAIIKPLKPDSHRRYQQVRKSGWLSYKLYKVVLNTTKMSVLIVFICSIHVYAIQAAETSSPTQKSEHQVGISPWGPDHELGPFTARFPSKPVRISELIK